MKRNFKVKSKNRKVLESFVDYCNAHPEERFWQALRNWSKFSFIYGIDKDTEETTDTFYLKGKDK